MLIVVPVVDYRLTVTTQGSMKTVFTLAIAFSFLSVTMAVTQTIYVNALCTGALLSTPGVPNPLVSVLGVCQPVPVSSGISTSSSKYTTCAGTTATWLMYGMPSGPAPVPADVTCSLASTGANTVVIDQCFSDGGSGSYKITCASGTSITLALVSVAVAVLSFCL